jgi:hypothetical protein
VYLLGWELKFPSVQEDMIMIIIIIIIIIAIIKNVNYSTHPAYIVTQSLHHHSLSTQKLSQFAALIINPL